MILLSMIPKAKCDTKSRNVLRVNATLLKKLPKTKDLSIEYAELLKKKKEAYPDYRKAQDEMQELMKAQKNVEMFFAEEKDTAEKEPTR